MCLIYAIQIPLVVLVVYFFESPDLAGIVLVPGMALIIPIQILVCHDKAWDYFIKKHPRLKQMLTNQVDAVEEDQENTFEVSAQISMDTQASSSTRKETVQNVRDQASNGNLQATLREAQNEGTGSRLIFVMPAPGNHL